MKTYQEINAEILKPFYEIANRIICETTIELNVTVSFAKGQQFIFWYADHGNKHYGRITDQIVVDDDMSEDHVVRWVMELTEIYNEYVFEESDEPCNEESQEQIWSYENHRMSAA